MPYLRLTCPPLDPAAAGRGGAADAAVNDLFFHPRARLTREELRERTTVHFAPYGPGDLFAPYGPGDLFIGGRTPEERGAADVTVELSDWHMSVRQRRRVARELTPVLAELFHIPPDRVDGINIRFHPYPPPEFAVGGRLLSDLVPRVGQWMRRLAG